MRDRIVVIGISARAMAASARRAARNVVALDAFADADTHESAQAMAVGLGTSIGLSWPKMRRALRSLELPRDTPVVPGSGFERAPARLNALAAFGRVCANAPALVAALKDPELAGGLLAAQGWRVPETRLVRPVNSEGWLQKGRGGAGGVHVRAASARPRRGAYYQRFVEGTPMSVTFLADAERAAVLGYNRLLTHAVADLPYCYAGVVSGASLPGALDAAVRTRVDRLVRVTGLRGMAGLDFIYDGADVWALEVNPRPTASAELYDDAFAQGWINAHVSVFEGASAAPDSSAPSPPRRGIAVAYADDDVLVPVADWPGWCHDRPVAGTLVAAGAPFVSVSAAAAEVRSVQALLRERLDQVGHLAARWRAPGATGRETPSLRKDATT